MGSATGAGRRATGVRSVTIDKLVANKRPSTSRWRKVAGVLDGFLAWSAGSFVAFHLVRFPTRTMLIFFFLGTVPAALVGLGFERLAEALEPTDRVSMAARFQSIAIPIALSFALPILGALYVPGIRLTPVTRPPDRRRSSSPRAVSTATRRSTSCGATPHT